MYKDLINYQLAEGKTKEGLLQVGKDIHESWMKNQTGFIKWEICENKDGSFTDIVHWETEADAKASTEDMANIPNPGPWYACYKEGSVKSQNVNVLQTF